MKKAPIKKEQTSKGVVAWFVNNHVAANILMVLFLVGGLLSASGMRAETFPITDPRMITISVSYPGATPSEVSTSITKRAEDALIGIEGIKRISSKASEGSALIKVQLEDFADADYVYDEIEAIINSLSNFPPQDAEKPIITKMRVTPEVLTLALHGDVSDESLKYWSEIIEEEIRELEGVSLTSVRGVKNSQITVEISESNLRKYGLRLDDVDRAIKNHSTSVPAGVVESKNGEILLRVDEKKYTGLALEKVIIKNLQNGAVVTVGDIGDVIDGFESANYISKFNGEKAAFIEVKRSKSDDTLKIDNTIRKYLSTISLPKGLKVSIAQDETNVLKDRISLMVRNGILGFMLVFLILLLFLDLKLAFWISLAIPISFLGGLMILYQMGYSINMITLFALIVVLGIVVDDGIVVGESIFEAQSKDTSDNGVLIGVKAVMAPVTIGVVTTMAAFVPLLFSTGMFGQIVKVIPVVVISILFISLIEAYFILPSHLSGSSTWSRGIVARVRDVVAVKLENFLDNIFIPFVRKAVDYRYVTLAIFVVLIFATFLVVKTGAIRFVFMPEIESDHITIEVNMLKDVPFATTENTLLQIEEAAISVRDSLDEGKKYSCFKNLVVNIGSLSGGNSPFKQTKNNFSNNLGEVKINLVPSDFRDFSASQIESMIRKKVGNLKDVDSITYKSSLIKSSSDIEIDISHPVDETLQEIASELQSRILNINGTKEVNDDSQDGKNEYVFKISEEGRAVGLTPSYLGRQLRASYSGIESQRFQRGMSEIKVFVRYPDSERNSLAALQNMRIRLADGKEVPLSSVAYIQRQKGSAHIKSVNGKRITSVTAGVDLEITTANEVIAILEKEVLQKMKLKYPRFKYSFEGKSKEQKDDLSSLGRNMIVALLLIYSILGAQLRSYTQPIIIMLAIPFGIVGSVLGHLLLGYDLTFVSLFGMVALAGVVVNDSVVLIDYLNNQLLLGSNIYDSAILSVRRRFRPILLTTLSTCLGLLPMLLETSLQARFLIPMVVSLATGIVFASAIILLLVPCLVIVNDDIRNLFS